MRHKLICLCVLFLACRICAEAPVEYRALDGLSDPKRWSPSECEAAASPRTFWAHPALRMHIPVDFFAGEKQYPIGWPRMYLNLKADEQAWQLYDRFEFQLFTESSRTNLPKRPLMFHVYGPQEQKKLFPLDLATLGTSAVFTVNIADLDITGRVARLGFNINEADYADKDVIDFHIGGFRLARATVAQVTELKAGTPALFRDSRVLPVELVVEGPPEKLASGLSFQLRKGDLVAFAQTLPVTRGRQTLYLPLAEANLDPGTYSLVVCPDSPDLRKEVSVTVTSSPWQ